MRLGVKFYENGSSFKKKLLALVPGETIIASQCAGDFTLPRNADTKLAFIAGGIGITPFRSMMQYMIDADQPRIATLFFANKTLADVVYKETLDQAEKDFGLKTVYAFSDARVDLATIPGAVARIDAQTIAHHMPDYTERMFYLSGPRAMVESFDTTLKSMGVPVRMIKKDFFPGFA